MISFRTLAVAAVMATFCITGYAKAPVDMHHPDTAATGNMPMMMGDPDAQMTRIDEQMKAMQAMHDKMMNAKTPKVRNALMSEHMKLMQDGMAMMGEMGSGGMGSKKDKPAMPEGMGGMRDIHAKDSMDSDMGVRHQMMERRMQMMQSVMQMMLDRMPTAQDKP